MRSKVSFLSSIPGKKFPWQRAFGPLAKSILQNRSAVNIVLCTDTEQRELNRKYRGLNKVTDVLSFVWNEPHLLGEIYIAETQVKKQAVAYNNSYYNELKRVLVHGILHLCGYDHKTAKERKVMREKENFYTICRQSGTP